MTMSRSCRYPDAEGIDSLPCEFTYITDPYYATFVSTRVKVYDPHLYSQEVFLVCSVTTCALLGISSNVAAFIYNKSRKTCVLHDSIGRRCDNHTRILLEDGSKLMIDKVGATIKMCFTCFITKGELLLSRLRTSPR